MEEEELRFDREFNAPQEVNWQDSVTDGESALFARVSGGEEDIL